MKELTMKVKDESTVYKAPEGKTKCKSNPMLLVNAAQPDGSGLRVVSWSHSTGRAAPPGM